MLNISYHNAMRLVVAVALAALLAALLAVPSAAREAAKGDSLAVKGGRAKGRVWLTAGAGHTHTTLPLRVERLRLPLATDGEDGGTAKGSFLTGRLTWQIAAYRNLDTDIIQEAAASETSGYESRHHYRPCHQRPPPLLPRHQRRSGLYAERQAHGQRGQGLL